MGSRLLRYVRRHHVGLLALFVAMGGTAYAVEANSIRSRHIVNGQVRSPDVGDGQITSRHVRNDDLTNGGLQSEDVANGALQGVDLMDGSITGADIGYDSVSGFDINESTLSTVPSAELGGIARSGASGTCDPESETYVDCSSLSLTLPRSGRVLAIGEVEGSNEINSTDYLGDCRLTIDGQTFGSFASFDEAGGQESASMVGVTNVLGPGSHTVKIQCRQYEFAGAITYDDAQLFGVIVSAK